MEVVFIVLAALVVLLIVWMLVRKARERQLEGRREEAGELRQTARARGLEADQQKAQAEERAARARREAAAAEHQAARAESARAEAEQHSREAAEVDPDADPDDESQRTTSARDTSP